MFVSQASPIDVNTKYLHLNLLSRIYAGSQDESTTASAKIDVPYALCRTGRVREPLESPPFHASKHQGSASSGPSSPSCCPSFSSMPCFCPSPSLAPDGSPVIQCACCHLTSRSIHSPDSWMKVEVGTLVDIPDDRLSAMLVFAHCLHQYLDTSSSTVQENEI